MRINEIVAVPNFGVVASRYAGVPLERTRVVADACRIMALSTPHDAVRDAVRWLDYCLAVGVAE